MAMTGVLRPGHAQLRVLDLEVSRKFYRDVVGLVETGTDTQGRVYFKGWDVRRVHLESLRRHVLDDVGEDLEVGRAARHESMGDHVVRLAGVGLHTPNIAGGLAACVTDKRPTVFV